MSRQTTSSEKTTCPECRAPVLQHTYTAGADSYEYVPPASLAPEGRLDLSQRLQAMPGYLNGYDEETEADQHHAYKVGFLDALRAAVGEQAVIDYDC